MSRTTLILSALATATVGIVLWVIFTPDEGPQTNPGDAGVVAPPTAAAEAEADSQEGERVADSGETDATERTELATLDDATLAATAGPGQGGLTLRVVDPEGEPIEGLTAELRPAYGGPEMFPWGGPSSTTEEDAFSTAASDAGGLLALNEVPAEEALRLVLRGDYWVQQELPIAALRDGETRDLGDLAVARGVLLIGRVLDEAGQPVEGAQVSLRERTGNALPEGMLVAGMGGGTNRQAETDADGQFELAGLPPKEYTVQSTRVGLVRAETNMILGLTNPDHRVELRMAEGGFVTGVVRSEDGTPLPDARVAVIPARGFANYQWTSERILEEGQPVGEDGAFRLSGVPDANSHRVVAAAPGFARGRSDRVVPGMKVEIGLAPRATLAGLVLDAGGNPVVDAEVTASPAAEPGVSRGPRGGAMETATTDETGAFAFNDLSNGRYDLSAVAPAGTTRMEGVEVGPATPDVEIRLPESEALVVRVTDAEGQAIENARIVSDPAMSEGQQLLADGNGGRRVSVSVSADGVIQQFAQGMTRRARTDAGGLARIHDLAEGSYDLKVTAEGYAKHTVRVTRDSEDEQLVVVELQRPSGLRVLAVDSTGTPIEGATLELERVDAQPKDSRSLVTDAWGLAVFQGLTPGDYELREVETASGPGFFVFDDGSGEGEEDPAEEVLRFTLEADTLGEQQIVLAAKTVPTVLVTRLGVPVPNASVSLSEKNASEFVMLGFPGMGSGGSTTNARGQATLPPTNPGTYILKARAKATNPYTELEVTMGPGQQHLMIELATGGVSGTITGPTGPLVDARISLNRVQEGEETTSSRAIGVISLATSDDDEGDVMSFDFSNADARANSGADGRFRFLDVPPGTYTMSIRAKDHSPLTTEPFEVTEGTQVDRGVVPLEMGASLEGRVVNIPPNSDGEQPVYTMIRLQNVDGETLHYGSVSRSGKYRFGDLTPGTYRVVVSLPGGEDRTSDAISVNAGAPTNFDFVL